MKKLDIDFEKYFKKYSYNINKVVGINPFDFDEIYSLEDRKISKISKKDVKQEHLISSYIPNKNVITYELKVQKNLLEKVEIYDYIETKCYEEVGLDEAEEYIFKYKIRESEADNKNVLIEVLIVSKKQLEEFYSPIKQQYGYLDYLTYPGFAFSVLYQEKILEPQNDLYIYFTKDDIFITLYSEGKFLQTLIIPEGLENIFDELNESIKIKNFTFDVFISILTKKGLDLNNYSEKEHVLFNELSELFSNKFLIISNQLHTIIRKFSLTTIDRIFMGTPKGVIPGISEFANMYLGVEANDLKFDIDYNPDNIEIDQILFLSMLYATSAYKNDNQEDNFTIYYRPPTFFYRPSGQFISISVASLIISLIYPTYQMIDTYFINSNNSKLEKKLNSLKNMNKKLESTNKKLKRIAKQKEKEKESLVRYINERKLVLDEIYKAKKGYIPKAKLIAIISKYLHDNKVYVKNISYGTESNVNNINKRLTKVKQNKKSVIELDVYAKESKDITKFINDLVYNQHLIVNTPGYIRINDFYTAKIIIKVEE